MSTQEYTLNVNLDHPHVVVRSTATKVRSTVTVSEAMEAVFENTTPSSSYIRTGMTQMILARDDLSQSFDNRVTRRKKSRLLRRRMRRERRALRALQKYVEKVENLPDDVGTGLSERAQHVSTVLFPDGLDILEWNQHELFGEMERRLRRVDVALREDIDAIGAKVLFRHVEVAHEAYKQAFQTPIPLGEALDLRDLHEKLKVLRHRIRIYVLLVAGWMELEPANVEVGRRLLMPLTLLTQSLKEERDADETPRPPTGEDPDPDADVEDPDPDIDAGDPNDDIDDPDAPDASEIDEAREIDDGADAAALEAELEASVAG